MSPTLVLFDDALARAWEPFALTRPIGELRFGVGTLRSRAEHALGLECQGHVAPELAGFEDGGAPVVEPGELDPERDVVFLLSRFAAEPGPLPTEPALLVADGRVVGCRVRGNAPPDPGFFHQPDDHAPDLPAHALEGTLLADVWDLVTANTDRVARDLAGAARATLPGDVHALGDAPISVGHDVEIAPGVVLDARDGPIRLDDGVVVHPYTRVVGPTYVGTSSVLLGGPFECASVGPVCKVHGEIEESIILGYTNKAHDGFLGHAYVGAWVNLGAMTTNSDLKNNYGPVRLRTSRGEVDTGQRKMGCFLGDHVKTAIGTLLNTGTVVGAGSNVFGGMPPKYVPPFSWGDADTAYGIDRFLETAATVMGRREVTLSDSHRQMLRAAWHRSRGGDDPASDGG